MFSFSVEFPGDHRTSSSVPALCCLAVDGDSNLLTGCLLAVLLLLFSVGLLMKLVSGEALLVPLSCSAFSFLVALALAPPANDFVLPLGKPMVSCLGWFLT